jgi:hypothetical protein
VRSGEQALRVELRGGVFRASRPWSEVAQRSNGDGVRASGAVRRTSFEGQARKRGLHSF